ncbi:putative membrane protein YeaQ/YmgE (transglycosylase-associated protein family) [Catenulispora sp. MAP12-49]
MLPAGRHCEIVGALLGGWLAATVFHVNGTQGSFNLSTWLGAIGGAVVLLVPSRLVTDRYAVRH